MYIHCDNYKCLNNNCGRCELGGSEFVELVIEDMQCCSAEYKEDVQND